MLKKLIIIIILLLCPVLVWADVDGLLGVDTVDEYLGISSVDEFLGQTVAGGGCVNAHADSENSETGTDIQGLRNFAVCLSSQQIVSGNYTICGVQFNVVTINGDLSTAPVENITAYILGDTGANLPDPTNVLATGTPAAANVIFTGAGWSQTLDINHTVNTNDVIWVTVCTSANDATNYVDLMVADVQDGLDDTYKSVTVSPSVDDWALADGNDVLQFKILTE